MKLHRLGGPAAGGRPNWGHQQAPDNRCQPPLHSSSSSRACITQIKAAPGRGGPAPFSHMACQEVSLVHSCAGVKWVGDFTAPMKLSPAWARVFPWAATCSQPDSAAACAAPGPAAPFVFDRNGPVVKLLAQFARPMVQGEPHCGNCPDLFVGCAAKCSSDSHTAAVARLATHPCMQDAATIREVC